jgi:hypothetical protein
MFRIRPFAHGGNAVSMHAHEAIRDGRLGNWNHNASAQEHAPR